MENGAETYQFQGEEIKEKNSNFLSYFLGGYALHKVITDDLGTPVDFEYVKVNDKFEILTGKSKDKLIGRKVTEVFPQVNSSSFNWIGVLGHIGLDRSRAIFSYFSENQQQWFHISVFSPEKGYFAIFLDDITKMKQSEMRFNYQKEELERLIDESRKQKV